MPVISKEAAYTAARSAGFTGSALDIIVAIAQAESSLNTTAFRPASLNPNGGNDRGILQINSRWHPEVSDACAYDAACAFREGYRISGRGTNFKPWSVYNSGAYRRYLQPGGASDTPAAPSAPAAPAAQLAGVEGFRRALLPNGQLISVWGDPRAGGRSHQGEDIKAPQHTPIYMPEAGTVTNNYVDSLGGYAIYIQFTSGLHFYGAHFSRRSPLVAGRTYPAGTVLGHVGDTGDAKGTPFHLHYQVGPNGNWGDPRLVLRSWRGGNAVVGAPAAPQPNQGGISFVTVGDSVTSAVMNVPGVEGLVRRIDDAEWFRGVVTVPCSSNFCIPETVQSIALTIGKNTGALAVRMLVAFIGLLLVAGLAFNAVNAAKGEIIGAALQ